jgi:hypothetical protein
VYSDQVHNIWNSFAHRTQCCALRPLLPSRSSDGMLGDVRVHDPASTLSCQDSLSRDINPLFGVPIWMQTLDPRRRVAQTKSPAWMAANQPSPRTSRCGRNAGRARRGTSTVAMCTTAEWASSAIPNFNCAGPRPRGSQRSVASTCPGASDAQNDLYTPALNTALARTAPTFASSRSRNCRCR